MPTSKNGFTLIEVLIAITVFCILAVFSYLYVPKYLQRARDASRKSNIKLITNTLDEYLQDNGCYPNSLPLCNEPITSGEVVLFSYLPCDPQTKMSYVYVSEGGDCPSWYQLYGNLEYLADSAIDKVGCRGGCGPDCQFNYGAASTNQKLDPFCEDTGSPAPTMAATYLPTQYACSPGGGCEIFIDPVISGCPNVYPDDPTCQDKCSDRLFRCHDSRGKMD